MSEQQALLGAIQIEAVRQITECGYPVADVAATIGVSQHSLCERVRRYSVPERERVETGSPSATIRKLRSVTEGRGIQ